MININTKEYWEKRFSSGDWETKKGRTQTAGFAKSQIPYLKIPRDFNGTILDFGCGLGDAIPVYNCAYPEAKLLGVDISESAILQCQQKHGHIARFFSGDHSVVPHVDVIISSNTLEHLSDDRKIVSHLLERCKELYIVVPYRQVIVENSEHVNSYDEHYFKGIGKYDCETFLCEGWSQYGRDLWYDVYFKNIFRPFFGKKIAYRMKQIMFHFNAEGPL